MLGEQIKKIVEEQRTHSKILVITTLMGKSIEKPKE